MRSEARGMRSEARGQKSDIMRSPQKINKNRNFEEMLSK
jgi:hypothetical protein